MKIQHLTIGGKKVPLYFGIEALEEITKGKSMAELGEQLIPAMKKTLFVGLKNGAKKAGVEFKMSIPKLNDMIDQNPSCLMESWKIFNEDAVVFFQMATDNGEEGKK